MNLRTGKDFAVMYVMKTYSVLFFLSEYIHILKVNGIYIYIYAHMWFSHYLEHKTWLLDNKMH